MAKKNIAPKTPDTPERIAGRRKKMEAIATFGLILVAVALLAPFASFLTGNLGPSSSGSGPLAIYKWIYAAGALIFTGARLVNVSDPNESLRMRRIRRLEFWAGMAFCIGAFFWFYNERRLAPMMFVAPMAILRDTVVFSLAGAMIQIISSWMLVWRQNKEARERANGQDSTKKGKK